VKVEFGGMGAVGETAAVPKGSSGVWRQSAGIGAWAGQAAPTRSPAAPAAARLPPSQLTVLVYFIHCDAQHIVRLLRHNS